MKLKSWLIANELSVDELARMLDVSRSSAYRFVGGTQMPTPKMIRKIKKVTFGKVSADDLVEGLKL